MLGRAWVPQTMPVRVESLCDLCPPAEALSVQAVASDARRPQTRQAEAKLARCPTRRAGHLFSGLRGLNEERTWTLGAIGAHPRGAERRLPAGAATAHLRAGRRRARAGREASGRPLGERTAWEMRRGAGAKRPRAQPQSATARRTNGFRFAVRTSTRGYLCPARSASQEHAKREGPGRAQGQEKALHGRAGVELRALPNTFREDATRARDCDSWA